MQVDTPNGVSSSGGDWKEVGSPSLWLEVVTWGYRPIHTLLRRECWLVTHKLVQRLYRDEGHFPPRARAEEALLTRWVREERRT